MRKKLLLTLTFFLVLVGGVFAQERTISGKITSASDGSALPGVNVIVAGTTLGTITDVSGKYTIKVPEGSNALEFSFVGMKAQTVVIGATNSLDVAMETSEEMLDEVVVTALGIQREVKALGYAQQKIGTSELSAARETNVTSLLTAKVAGVRVSKTSSGTGGSSAITIRGVKSLLGNNQPLFVVDGVPVTNIGHTTGGVWDDLDLGDGMGDFNPEDIESISVLKGPNASALYGARGSNGVVLITSKSGMK
jgi:TonB-dependent SusC/RagA subfamily outer membrane receptor